MTGKLWLPEKHWLKVWELLLSGTPYTVELIKGKDGRYRAHITFTITAPVLVTNPNRGYLGMDTNPDGVALANVNYFGQPEPWPEGFTVPYPKALHKFDGEFQVIVHQNGFLYIKIPELAYSRGFRRTYLIGVLAKVVVGIAKFLSKPIALENLDLGITKELKQKVQAIKEKLTQKANSLPGEGKGMTDAVKRLFKRLDGKVLVHNGLTRFKQESFYSVWHDLKQLVLLESSDPVSRCRTNR